MASTGKLGAFWSSVAQYDAANLLSNPSFETGTTTGWSGAVLAIVSDSWDGSYACSVAGDGTNAGSLSQTTAAASAAPGDVIAVRCAAKASGTPAGAATLKLEFFDSSAASVGSTSLSIPASATSWARYSLIHQAPANTDHFTVSVTTGVNDTYIVDDFQVSKLEQVGGFSNWSLTITADTSDVTAFEDNGWKAFIATQKGWTGSADRFWGSEEFFNHLASGNPIYCVFYIDENSDKRFEGLATVTGVNPKADVNAVVTETINFQGTSDISHHTT